MGPAREDTEPRLGRRARVLVVEDDADTRVLLAHALREKGHSALLTSTGRAALNTARSSPLDVVILDLVLPDISGLRVLETLRSDTKTHTLPVIILSGLTSEADRIRGLEAGADDYLTKPFSPRELMLRVDIALRRRRNALAEAVEAAGIRIEPGTHRAYYCDEPLALTPIEFGLLAALVGRAGQVQSREALLADVWGASPQLETRTVDTHIKRLRIKLGDAAEHIETVRGIGYRFRAIP